jgi:hypothetical protein
VALSGPAWVAKFPTSEDLADLAEPFRGNAMRFVSALTAAGASVAISTTFRPPERAYLMHFAFDILKGTIQPGDVPPMAGVDIQWVHAAANGTPDPVASKTAAARMVSGYNIVFRPVLTSRHTERNAVDMTITWQGNLTIANADGTTITIATTPRNGGNTDLHAVGQTYGVIKLVKDPPHWSNDGH